MRGQHIKKLSETGPAERRAWSIPTITELPPLQDLTLQTGFAGADTGFGWLKG